MSMILWAVALCAGSYLVGSIPFGYLVARAKGVDIRTAGSGNIGATNVGRVLGRPWGVLCFALDVAKGVGPTLAAGAVLRSQCALPAELTSFYLAWLAAGICCVLGHNFPIFLGFRGGKGVATSLGVVLGVYPYLTIAGLLAFAVWIVVTLTTRYVSAGSIAAAGALPFLLGAVLWRAGEDGAAHWPLIAFAVLAASLVIYRHRGNVARLRQGTENRIGTRTAPPAKPAS